MKKFLFLLCFILSVPCCASGDSIYTNGSWYDTGDYISIKGLSIQNWKDTTDYNFVELHCFDKTCTIDNAILTNVGTETNKIWNIKPLHTVYEIIDNNNNFLIAKNGSTTIEISKKNKTIDWIFYDKTYKIITNQQDINKYLLSK